MGDAKITPGDPIADLDDPIVKAWAEESPTTLVEDEAARVIRETRTSNVSSTSESKPSEMVTSMPGRRRSQVEIMKQEIQEEVEERAEDKKRSLVNRVFGSGKRSAKSRIEQVYRRGSLPMDAAWYILNPKSAYLKRWDIYVMVLLLFTALVTPFEVAFLTTEINFMFFINRLIDLSFVKDMIMNFLTARYVEETGKWRYTVTEIGAVYAKGWFLIDLISVLPFDVVGILFDSDIVSEFRILRVVRLFRLMKLARIFRASRIFARWENQISLSYSWLSLIKFMVGVATVAHWMACMWRMVVDIEADTSVPIDEQVNWMTTYGMVHTPPGEEYIAALYWSVMTITTIGYGDVVPTQTGERVLATISMLVGASIYAYVVGAVCGIVSGLDEATSQFHATMDDLNRYMEEYSIPNELRMSLREYFRHCRGLARQRHYHDLLVAMSPSLRGQVAVFCHSSWILKVPFFNHKSVSDDERENFIIQLALMIEPMSFAPNEPIIRVNQPAHEMYIVQKGVVAKMGKIINSGQFFGEDMILKEYNRPYSVRSLTYVDVFRLTKKQMDGVVKTGEFPGTEKAIRMASLALAFRIKFCQMSKTLGIFNMKRVHKIARRSMREASIDETDTPPVDDIGAAVDKDSVLATRMSPTRVASSPASFGAAEDLTAIQSSLKALISKASAQNTTNVTNFAALAGKVDQLATAVERISEKQEKHGCAIM